MGPPGPPGAPGAPGAPGLTPTFSADNGGTTIGPIVVGPASTALAATGVIAVPAGARVEVWARVFYHITGGQPGTLFTGVVAIPQPPGPPVIYLDGTADTIPAGVSDRTVTFAGSEGSAGSFPALPAGSYIFELRASKAVGALAAVVDGLPPAVTPGARLTVAVIPP